MAQIIFFNLGNIDSIITDLTILNIVKTVDQIGNCRFSCTGRSDKRKLLSRFCIQADIMKDCLVLIISKGYIFKSYITL